MGASRPLEELVPRRALSSFLMAACCCLSSPLIGPEPALSQNPAFEQKTTPSRAVTQYQVRFWSGPEIGLSNPILALSRDSFGGLWLGTESGLFRFDGISFIRVALEASGPVTSIASASDALWIAAGGRLHRIDDPVSGIPHQVSDPRPGAAALSLQVDSGDLWVGTDQGLIRQTLDGFELVPFADSRPREVSFLTVAPSGQLYAVAEGTVWSVDDDQLTPISASTWPPTETVNSLAAGPEAIFAATDAGIFRWSGSTWNRASSLAASRVLTDREGSLWALSGGSLLRFAGDGRERLTEEEGLAAEASVLLEDGDGCLWVGGRGLSLLDPGELIAYTAREGLPESPVRTVLEDSTGRIWIGTDGGGLSVLSAGSIETFTVAQGLPSEVILSLAQTPDGSVWAGTASNGLIRWSGGRFQTLDSSSGLPGDSVTALTTDAEGRLWIGTLGAGASRFDGDGFATITSEDGLASNLVRSLIADSQGAVWVGTEGGLSRWLEGKIKTLTRRDGLAGDLILSLLEDDDSLWVGTDAGLSRVTPSGIRTYDRSDGLPSESIAQIQRSEDRLWLCTNKGLFSLELAQLEELDFGRRSTLTPFRPRGAPHECNGYSQPASAKARDGVLWFAALDGVLALEPSAVAAPLPAKIRIAQLWADGEPVSLKSPVRLLPRVRSIDIDVTSSDLLRAEETLIQYRLLDDRTSWSPSSRRRTVRYTNLPPGPHSFEVRAAGNLSGRRGSVSAFDFEIGRPFYRTPRFAAAALLFFSLFGRGLYQLRLQQILQRNERLSARVAEGTSKVLAQKQELDLAHERQARANEQLRRANEKLFELDRENTDLLALAAHGLRGPLLNLQGFSAETEHVLEKLREVAEEARQYLTEDDKQDLDEALYRDSPEALGFIRASTDRMDQLIHAILTLARLGRQKLAPHLLDLQGLVNEVLRSLSFQIGRSGAMVEVGELPVVVADHNAIRLVFENLLNNAILYLSPKRPGLIQVEAEEKKDSFVFHVKDNGVGIAPAKEDQIFKLFGRAAGPEIPGEGMGLAYVRTVVERQGGRIWFRSTVDEGTVFSFSLPKRTSSPSLEGEDS